MILAFVLAMTAVVGADSTWVSIIKNRDAKYEALKSSFEFDMPTQSVQFIMKTTLDEPVNGIKYLLENVVVLCEGGNLITLNQDQYDSKSKRLNLIPSATVFKRGDASVASYIIVETCIGFPTATEPKKEPLRINPPVVI